MDMLPWKQPAESAKENPYDQIENRNHFSDLSSLIEFTSSRNALVSSVVFSLRGSYNDVRDSMIMRDGFPVILVTKRNSLSGTVKKYYLQFTSLK